MDAVKLENRPQIQSGETSNYIYLLRIFAIFAIIVMNTAKYDIFNCGVSSFNWQILNIFGSLARWAVPVFVMIAGVIFLDMAKDITVGTMFKTHLLKMLCIYFFWSFIYAVVQNILNAGRLTTEVFTSVLVDTVKGPVHFWYIPMLSGLYLITPFLRVLVKNSGKRMLEYFLLLCFIFGSVLPVFQSLAPQSVLFSSLSSFKLFFAAGYTGYFVLGCYLHNFPLKKIGRRLLYVAGIISLATTIAGTYMLSLRRGQLDDTLYSNLSPNYVFIGAALFVFFEVNVKKIKFSDRNTKCLRTVSLCTFGVYILHYFSYIFFSQTGFSVISVSPLISVPLVSLCIYLSCLLVSYLLSKIPVVKKYLV